MALRMPAAIKVRYKVELRDHYKFLQRNDFMNSWNSLERSHILGQSYPLEHTWSHLLMLRFGFKVRNVKEVQGQIPRLLVAGIKSFVGVIPVGNTGGVNVPPLRSMEIPQDLHAILNNKNTL